MFVMSSRWLKNQTWLRLHKSIGLINIAMKMREKKNVDFYPRHFRSEFISFVVITFSLLILIAGCFMFVAHLPQINLLLINCTESCWNRFLLHSFRTCGHPHYSIRRGADRVASITIFRRNDFRFAHKSNQDDFQCHFPPKMPLTFFVFMYHVMFAAG